MCSVGCAISNRRVDAIRADTIEERTDQILVEKRALFADLVDGLPMNALARLDLDSLLRAAAPRFRA